MQLNAGTKQSILLIFLITVTFFFSACSKKITFLNSSVVPAAQGDVRVSRDKNKNNVIKIHIVNLADPERLQPARKYYIVWMTTDNDLTKNMGQIKSSRTMFNKRMEGTFETITSFHPIKIFLTAEDETDTQYPHEVILSTSNF